MAVAGHDDGARGLRLPRAIVALVLLASCTGSGATEAGPVRYAAELSGARELPAAVTAAAGRAVFERTGAIVTYQVTASGFTTPLVVGHIHLGGAGVAGPVLVPLAIDAQSGVVAAGSIDLSRPVVQGNITISGDSLRVLFDNGGAYVNLHTAAWPGGEIRGQIVRQ